MDQQGVCYQTMFRIVAPVGVSAHQRARMLFRADVHLDVFGFVCAADVIAVVAISEAFQEKLQFIESPVNVADDVV